MSDPNHAAEGAQASEHRKFKHWPLWMALGIIGIGTIVHFCLPASWSEYEKMLYSSGKDDIIEGDAVMALLFLVASCVAMMLICVVTYLFIHHKQMSWHIFGELTEKLELIGVLCLFGGIALWLFIFGPHKTVTKLKTENGILMQTVTNLSQTNITLMGENLGQAFRLMTISNDDVQLIKWQWDTLSTRLTNPNDPCDWLDCGRSAMIHDKWQVAARFFTNAISLDESRNSFCEARIWPLLCLAVLESDPPDTHPEGVGIFKESMERETGNIAYAIANGSKSASEFKKWDLLSNNLVDLAFVRDVLIEKRETNLLPVIDQIITTVDQHAKEAATNGW